MIPDQAIRKFRRGTLTIRAKPGQALKVTQMRHEFQFGTAISSRMFSGRVDPQTRKKYLDVLQANFNSAVHENALKWYSTERSGPGADYTTAERIWKWCHANGIVMRGHCIFWAVDKYVQPWVKNLDDKALRKAVEKRAKEVTTRFRGRIIEYDVNNEMLAGHGNYYRRRLGDGITADMFRWARQGDPGAALYVNDYGILSGRHAAKYEKQIAALLKRKVPLGGIGCQSHFGRSIDIAMVKKTLDRLAKFKLPVKITEFDINTDDERAKARYLREFYHTCFAHPAVEGIYMWGFWGGAHWRPKAALWNKDFTPTPAAKAYRDLVFNQWWTRWEGRADENGLCKVRVFFGKHRVQAGGRIREVTLRPKEGGKTVDLSK